MKFAGSGGVKFILLVVIPALMTVAIMASAIFNIIGTMSEQTNAIAAEKTELAASAALTSFHDQNRKIVEDNSNWDEAVRRVYGKVDDEWVEETWGSTIATGLYDYVFILEASGSAVSGFGPAGRIQEQADTIIGRQPIAALIRKAAAEKGAVAGLAGFGGKYYSVATAPLVPTSQDLQYPKDAPRYLTIVLQLNNKRVSALGSAYVIDGLQLDPLTTAAKQGVAVADIEGMPLAKLTWIAQQPGDIVRDKAQAQILSSLAVVFGVLALLLAAIWQNGRRNAASQAAAVYAAHHDELSGLPNRRQFGKLLAEAVKQPFALLFIDIDRFKAVNDAYGHEMGDKLIRAIAAGLTTLAPEGSVVARLGGDEFGVLLTSRDSAEEAPHTANMIIAFMGQPFDFDGRVAAVGASIGILDGRHADAPPDELVRRADAAMYRAKKTGRNRYHHYDPSLESERHERRRMATALRQAMKANEISLVYQPYVSASSRQIIGVEALLRWNSPELGHVNPAVFVSVAEEFGLIDELGMAVLFAACGQAAFWPGLKMSVNVSPAQFSNAAFIDTISAAMARAGITGDRLELEVTEGYLIDEPELARALIYRLHDLGVAVSIDDFGTGFSSIGYLRKFSFDKLKIDRSLVEGLMTNAEAQKIIQATVLLADALGLQVTAEGVEHEEEAMLLRAAGVDQFQGYLFHRPMTAEAVTKLLSATSADLQAPSAAAAA